MSKRRREGRVGGEGRRGKDLLNVISGDVVGVIGCHQGLHLHQVLLHLSRNIIALYIVFDMMIWYDMMGNFSLYIFSLQN